MRFLIIPLLLFFSAPLSAAVWTAGNSWNSGWEDRYSQWIENELTKDYFVRGPYGPVATDCADLAYAARVIFAFENKLPFLLKSQGRGLSERTSQFDGITNPRARFIAFLNHVLEITSTHTLSVDTYPVPFDRAYLRPGTVFLQLREGTGHAEIVSRIFATGVLQFAGSTLPKKVRDLVFTTSLTVMPQDTSSGFRAWIRPEQLGTPLQQLPGYSLEQFSGTKPSTAEQLRIWKQKLQNKLALESETVETAVLRHSQDLCTLAQARVEVVRDAYEYKNKVRRCLNAPEYDAYSTPGKDKRLLRTLEQGLTYLFPEQKRLQVEMIEQMPGLKECAELEYLPGRYLSLTEFLKKLARKQVASDPNETAEERWGIIPINGNSCPQY